MCPTPMLVSENMPAFPKDVLNPASQSLCPKEDVTVTAPTAAAILNIDTAITED